jgi:myotubularin-related protein 1/2
MQLKETFDVLFKFAYPPELNSLFAFTYKQYFLRETDKAKGQDARKFTDPEVYDATKEYTRLGLASGSGFRITEANKDYLLCPTYPEVLVIPEKVTDEQLFVVRNFRSRGRIPAVVWRHPVNGSTISRCSQPNVGLKRHQCPEDVILLSGLRNLPHNLHVLDSRPKTNAMANSFKGGGYEQAPYHKECFPVEFHNVENIHAVRNSLHKLYKLCRGNKPYNNKHWKSGIEETKWLDTIKSILLSAARIVELVNGKGHSVMIHCSDG